MTKIEIKNNGCAEVAHADLSGNILIPPGVSTLSIPDASVKSLMDAMKRRAPQVFIRLIVDEAKPVKKKKRNGTKPKGKPSGNKKKSKPDASEKPDSKKPSNDGGEE